MSSISRVGGHQSCISDNTIHFQYNIYLFKYFSGRSTPQLDDLRRGGGGEARAAGSCRWLCQIRNPVNFHGISISWPSSPPVPRPNNVT